ncbi:MULTISPECIES: metal-dependent hydrolase [Haloferax]|uniref:Metal-dependent hydrolase n=1 Tax=Haloferax marinum TaxID=2666143 RepID=A0A6A8GAM7_9EURY|nr:MULTISPECIES: metal-dependent hydrolase [Haloferax]KAB1198233.1 metal-dependent hydrolase [Haloferax sp. CBA1150]MRW97323.1 metal-dependent hydrolase [Haloferax marinum]
MLPWTHAAFGYLLYSWFARSRYQHAPIGLAVFAVVFGTQFPDLVDKPLAWSFDILAYGRSLGHSVFTMGLIVGLLWWAFSYRDQRELTIAFAVGYTSHLVGDAVDPLVEGELANLGYVLWPLTRVPADDPYNSFLEFFLSLEFTGLVLLGVGITLVGLTVWVYDGFPGVADMFGNY